MTNENNPYKELVQQDTAERARVSMMDAVSKSPDVEVKLQNLAKQYGMPVDAVRLRQPEIETQAKIDALDYKSLARNYPKTAGKLADPGFSSIAHDDVENLSEHERLLRDALASGRAIQGEVGRTFRRPAQMVEEDRGFFGGVTEPVQRGLAQGRRGLTFLLSELGVFGGLQRQRDAARSAAGLQPEGNSGIAVRLAQQQRQIDRFPIPENIALGMQEISGAPSFGDALRAATNNPLAVLETTLQSVGGSAPALVGALAGSMAGPIGTASGAGLGSFAVEYGNTLQEVIAESGVNPNDPLAISNALNNQELMSVAREKAVKRGVPIAAFDAMTAGLAGRFLAAARPTVASVVARSGGELALQAGGGAAGEATAQAVTGEWRPGDILLEALAELPSAIVEVPGNYRDALGNARAAEQHAQALQDVVKLAEASKVRQRSPETFAQFAQSLVEESVPNLYIDANALMQSENFQAIAKAVPSVAEQIEEAAATGGDVVIPTQEFLSAVPGSEFAQDLIENARTSPDAMSQSEARVFMQERGTQLQTQIEDAVAAQQENETWKQGRDQLQADFAEQLNAAKRFTPDANAQYASMMANFYAVTASKLNTTPQELAQRYGLRVQAQEVNGGQRLDQGDNAGVPDNTNAPGQPGGAQGANQGSSTTSSKFSEDNRLSRLSTTGPSWERIREANPELAALGLDDEVTIYRATIGDSIRPDDFVAVNKKTLATELKNVKARDKSAKIISQKVKVRDLLMGNDATEFVYFPEQSAPVSQGATMAQEARGSINLPDDITQAPSIISLFKGADLSTFIHESGHFFLEVQMDLAARIQAQINGGASVSDGEKSIVDDANKILAWFGVKGSEGVDPLTEWFSMDLEAKRPMHEKWARGFEAYAFEGNAPSIELQGVFQKFRTWLVSIYKNLKALNVELTDDVRGVMDRMLASEQAIEEAQAARAMGPLFKTAEDAGMTPEEFAAYHAMGGQATQDAIDYLQERGLRDMKWLDNAKNRKLKELQKQVAEMRREVRTQVRGEVMRKPVYRAWQFLTGRPDAAKDDSPELAAYREILTKWTESRALVELDARESEKAALLAENPQANGLERGQLIAKNKKQIDLNVAQAMLDWEKENPKPVRPATPEPQGPDTALYGKLDADELTTRYGAKGWQRLADLKMTRKSGGLPSDIVAEANGFGSGDEMVKAIMEAEPPKVVIEALTDQRMLERFGDIGTPEGLQRAVDMAIHNEARARFVATEIRTLERGSSVRSGAGRSTVDVLTSAAKAHARRVIGGTKVRDLKPGRYTAAEARAAKAAEKAMVSGKAEEALTQKRNQLINLQMAKATMDARDESDKAVRYLRKFSDKPKSLDADYYDQIASLLDRYDLANVTLKSVDKRKSLAAWVESQREQGMEPDIPPELLDESRRQSYKELTFDELQGLRDTVRQIENLGRLKNTLLTAKMNRDFQAVRDVIAESVTRNANGRSADTRTPATVLGRRLMAVKNFGAAHIKAATWARVFDGGDDGGPMWEYFIRPANEAANMETTMRAEATQKLHAILSPVIKAGRMDGKGQFFPSINRSMNREQVFSMALNMGNEGNIQRMLDGEGWSVQQIQPVVATLSSEDWKAVQAIWDHFESYRPLIGAKERRIYGKEPQWVEPVPLSIQASDGQMVQLRGGYYPVKYDPLANNRAEQHSDAEDAKRQMQAAYTSATTRRGFTKSRVEAVRGRPLLYSLAAIYSNTNDVIHDLAFHEWLIDVNKLLRSDKINDTIRETYGPAAVKQIKTWIEDTARGEQGLQAEMDSMLGRLRQGVSIAGLGFNVMSAAIQPIGITQSVVRIGGRWVGRGVSQYLSDPIGKAREVNEKSEFMASRARTRFRELNELRNQVEGEHPVRTWMSNAAFYMMTRMQMTVDIPTWLGAYEKAMSEGNTDERASALADQAVIDAQGGGQMKDLSAIERGGPAQKLFTVFYSFFNTSLNLGVSKTMTEKSKAKLAADYLLLYSVPAVLTVMLKDALTPGDSGDWEDLDEVLRKLMEAQLDQLFGLMVGVREVAGAAKMALGLSEYAKDYQGPAGLRLFSDITGLAIQVEQGEVDDAFRKRAINVLGSGFGLPAAQINRTFSGTQALIEGETVNPAALAFGFQEP